MKLRRDEMDKLRVIHDYQLNLPERWFAGEEWKDGTATEVLSRDYRKALIEAGHEGSEDSQGELY